MQTFFRVVILEYCLENIEVKYGKMWNNWSAVSSSEGKQPWRVLQFVRPDFCPITEVCRVFRPNTEQSTHMVSLNVQLLF